MHTTKVVAIFVTFLPILAKNWLPWQRPLDPCNRKCLRWIGRPRKPPVISNHILVSISFICICSKFIPKLVAMVTPRRVTDEFPDITNPISESNSSWICRIQLKLWPFLLNFGLFWPKFGCHGNVP